MRSLFIFCSDCLHLVFRRRNGGADFPSRTDFLHATPTPAPSPAAAPEKGGNVNDIARFIAGLAPEHDAQLAEYAKTAEWIAYSAYMNERWRRFRLRKIGADQALERERAGQDARHHCLLSLQRAGFYICRRLFPKGLHLHPIRAGAGRRCPIDAETPAAGELPSAGSRPPLKHC